MVTHKMLEILVGVARMPIPYIKLRHDVLKNDYERHLTDPTAMEAFHVMIGDKTIDEISDSGRACYESCTGMADTDIKARNAEEKARQKRR